MQRSCQRMMPIALLGGGGYFVATRRLDTFTAHRLQQAKCNRLVYGVGSAFRVKSLIQEDQLIAGSSIVDLSRLSDLPDLQPPGVESA